MSYFEGIGDEVLVFTLVLAIVLAIIIASLIHNTQPNINQRLLHEQFIHPQFNTQASHNDTLDSGVRILETIPESPAETEFQLTPEEEEVDPSTTNNNLNETLTGRDDNLSDVAQSVSINNEQTNINDVQSEESKTSCENKTEDLEDSDDPLVIRRRRLDFFTNQGCPNDRQVSETVINEGLQNQSNGSVVNANEQTNETESVSEPQTSAFNQTEDESNVDTETGQFTLRLKFLDDRERVVSTSTDELISGFKRRLFPEELSQRKVIRLIYSGQQLQDVRTIGSYRLTEGSVVHIQISSGPAPPQSSQTRSNEELDMGQFLWPILGVVLGGLWIVHYQYREMFNASSTVALLGLSGLFVTFVWAQFGQQQPLQQTQ